MKQCIETKSQIDDFSNISKQQRQNVYAHIATCEQCADYKETADSTADLLGIYSSALKKISANERTFEKIEKRANKDRRSTLIALAGMVTSIFAGVWFYGQGNLEIEGGMVLLMWALGCGLSTWWFSRKATRFSSLSNDQTDEFMVDWRNTLIKEKTVTSVVASVLLIEIVFIMFNLLMDDFSSEGAIILFLVESVLAIGVIYAFFIEIPALKKELMLIKEDT